MLNYLSRLLTRIRDSLLLTRMRDLVLREKGQDTIEYALLIALVALGATAALASFATEIGQAFSTIDHALRHNLPHPRHHH